MSIRFYNTLVLHDVFLKCGQMDKCSQVKDTVVKDICLVLFSML